MNKTFLGTRPGAFLATTFLAFGIVLFGSLSGGITVHAQSVSTTVELSPTSLSEAVLGSPYSATLMAQMTENGMLLNTSTATSWGVIAGALPPGITLQSTDTNDQASGTATLSGTPITMGDYTFTLSASNNMGSATQNYSIDVVGSSTTNTATTASTTATSTVSVASTTTTVVTTTVAPIDVDAGANPQAELTAIETALEEIESELGMTVTTFQNTSPTASTIFYRPLTIGDNGSDVQALQEFLNHNGYPVATTGPGSAGEETQYFGPLTAAALAQWQAANGITPAGGNFDATTEARIESTTNSQNTNYLMIPAN